MSSSPNRRDIEFKAYEGDILRGWFYPPLTPKAPVIVMAHGLGGLKEHFLDDFATRFQSAGYAVLVYDNRNWGASGGHPRYEANPWTQVEDYHAVVGFATTLPSADPSRIAVWGTSYSGGNVLIAAAVDPRVKAVISQVPFTSGEAIFSHFPEGVVDAYFANRAHGVDPEYVPLFASSLEQARAEGGPKPILGTEDAFEYWVEAKARSDRAGAEWENKISLQTFYHMAKNEAGNFIHRIAPRPLLYVVAMTDSVLSPEQQLAVYAKGGDGKELLKLEGGHFDAYRGRGFEVNIKRQVEFLKRHLH